MSFLKLWEQSQPGRDFWDNKKNNPLSDNAIQVIVRGLQSRPDRADGKTFWDDFISVIGNNSEGASELFGVNREIVSNWAAQVRKGLDKVKEESESRDKSKMIDTGNSDEQ